VEFQRNAELVSVHLFILPDELLQHIFLLAADDADEDNTDVCDSHMRTNFALLCRRMHHLILHTPALWSKVNYEWPSSQYQTYITRSGGTPLIVWDSNGNHSRPYLDRAQSVVLRPAQVSVDPEFSMPSLPEDAPRLTSLNIEAYDHRIIKISTMFLGGNPVSLIDLRIHGFCINFPPRFPSLRSLTLRRFVSTNAIGDLTYLLKQCPQLEELSTQGFQTRWATSMRVASRSYPTHPMSTVGLLPHLKTLRIVDTARVVSQILDALPYPSHELHVSIRDHMEHGRMGSPPSRYIPARVLDFWKQHAAEEMPPGTWSFKAISETEFIEEAYFEGRIDTVVATFSINFDFDPNVKYIGIDTVYLRLAGGFSAPGYESCDGLWPSCSTVQMIVVEDASCSRASFKETETFMEIHVNMGCPIRTLIFKGCSNELELYAHDLARLQPETRVSWNEVLL
jgi:hypothetical protein